MEREGEKVACCHRGSSGPEFDSYSKKRTEADALVEFPRTFFKDYLDRVGLHTILRPVRGYFKTCLRAIPEASAWVVLQLFCEGFFFKVQLNRSLPIIWLTKLRIHQSISNRTLVHFWRPNEWLTPDRTLHHFQAHRLMNFIQFRNVNRRILRLWTVLCLISSVVN